MADPVSSETPPPSPPPLPLPLPLQDLGANVDVIISTAATQTKQKLTSLPRPPIRLTSEFDSGTAAFLHKASCRVLGQLAKLKFSFQHDARCNVVAPRLALVSPNLSFLYDLQTRDSLLSANVPVADSLLLRVTHDLKEKQGEVTIAAKLDPCYKLEVSSSFPRIGLPRASLLFPYGQVSVEEKESDEMKRVLSVSGIVKANVLNGVGTALYKENDLNLRYCFKDQEMSFIPSISLPSNALSFAFKRRFSLLDKLSYWYHFDSSEWSTVYKRNINKDLKFKAGYDSAVRLGWASFWVGEEDGKVKTAPFKMKLQFMLQVPQDDIGKSVILFRVKKRQNNHHFVPSPAILVIGIHKRVKEFVAAISYGSTFGCNVTHLGSLSCIRSFTSEFLMLVKCIVIGSTDD